jgi:hypothetical protein
MSLPNSSTLCAFHSHRGSRGGCHGDGLGSSVGKRHSPRLGATLCWHFTCCVGGNYSTGEGWWHGIPHGIYHTCLLPDVRNFVALSQGHSVFFLSQSQSTLAANRKGNSRPQKGIAAKKRRGQSDTNDGTKYKAVEKRRGKIDTKDDAKYNDEEDVLPVTDAPFGEKQWEERRLAAFNTATVVVVHQLEFMQRAFHTDQQMMGRKRPRVLLLHLLKRAGRRVRLTTSCIS